MLEWLGTEADPIRVAFSKVFGSRWKPYGTQGGHIGGFSDDRDGVQWNVGYDPRDDRRWVGVNLEGMQYDDWPIWRLIEREAGDPTLPALVKQNKKLHDVTLLWRRDYWQASARPEIEERFIGVTPLKLGELTEPDWRSALDEAAECLTVSRKSRGRAKQTVTLADGKQVKGEVSPHLTFEYENPAKKDWEKLFREARTCMEPLHAWAVQRARQVVRFG